MRRILLIMLLMIGAHERAMTSEKPCSKAYGALNEEAKRRLSSSRDFDRFVEDLTWFKVELECHTLRKPNASKEQRRTRFLARLQMRIVDTLDARTLSPDNCEDRIVGIRSNTSGSMFADGEYAAYIDWITHAAEKVCRRGSATPTVKQDRNPAQK